MLIDDVLLYYKEALKYRLILCKPTYDKIGALEEAFNINYKDSLNGLNELSFSLPFILDNKRNENIDKVQANYLIYMELYEEIENIVYQKEYFLINNIENVGDDKDIKRVRCTALENQLASKLIKSYSGSKKLYRTPQELAAYSPSEEYPTYESFRESGIINTVLRLAPSWKIGSIDEEINSFFREFNVDSTSALSFLLDTVQESFGCIFEFNTLEKTISAKALDHLGSFHGFFLSDSAHIKAITETTNTFDICTKLFIYGKDNLSIRTENILSEEYILDFSYYRNLNFMSQSLLNALDEYDALIESKRIPFEALSNSLNNYADQLMEKNADLSTFQEELEELEKEKDQLISDEEDLSYINGQIDNKNAEIEAVESEIIILQGDIASVTAEIEELQLLLLMESNFTSEQIAELDFYIREKELRLDSITDAAELYEHGLKALQKNNQPCVQLDLDVISLFDCVECQNDWDKLKLGDTACIHYDMFNIDIEVRIISYAHDSENNKLTISFGNRKNIHDPNMILDEIKSSIATTTTLDYNKNRYLDYVNSGDKTRINQYVTNALDLSKQRAIAASNQSVVIDQRGISLTDPSDTNNQVRMMNDLVVFTKDGWQTSSTAISARQGIVAEAVAGTLGEFCFLAADQLVVGSTGEGLSEEVLGDKVVLKNKEYNRVTINTEDGIKALHPADNSYTRMNGDGFLRFTPKTIYSESPTSANTENFTANNTILKLESKGWVFNNNSTIDTGRLRVGGYRDGWGNGNGGLNASVSQYITKDHTTFNFSYSTSSDFSSTVYFYIDNVRYELGTASTATTFQSKIGGTVTLNKGWHTFIWCADSPINGDASKYLYIDDITFEQSPVRYDPSGSYYPLIGSTYNYLTHSGTGSSPNTMTFNTEDSVPDVWVQLSDEFKGKDFNVDVFLQDTGEEGADYCVNRVLVKVVDGSIDYTNARFKVRARIKRTYYGLARDYSGSYSLKTVSYWRGCDFTYIVTV